MVKLSEVAKIVRSKNAGPYLLAIDVILESRRCYNELRKTLSRTSIAKLYRVDEDYVVNIHFIPQILAVKIVLKRTVPSGEPGDTDVYGAQQHAPLLSLELGDC